MKFRHPSWLLAGLLLGSGAAHAEGTVTVAFVQPEHFADAGSTDRDRETNLNTLTRQLERLGREHLADGQVLKLEVLDVELAGVEKHRAIGNVRVVRGGADWPSVTIRYSLEADGRVLQSGEDMVADMDYLHHVPTVAASQPLGYEQRMLARWFERRFDVAKAAKG